MLSRSTTTSLFVAVGLAAAATLFVFQNVPPAGGTPRQRFLILADIHEFDSLEIETTEGILACQRQQGTWWVTRPVPVRADDERIQRLLDALAVAPVRDVISPDEQRIRNVTGRDFGLAAPQARVFLDGPAVPSVELRFGKTAPDGGTLYAGLTGAPGIWVTDAALLEVLPTGIGDVRDRALLPYPTSRLARFELRAPGSPLLAAEMDPEGLWWIRQPEQHRASPQAIAALLSYVENTKILAFVHTRDHEEGGLRTADDLGIAYGCTPEEAALVARFWFPTARSRFEFHEFRVGRPSPEAEGQVYLLSTEERLVVTVPSAFPQSLRVNLDDLRDHRLWPFEAKSVQRLALKGETGSAAVERTPGGGWAVREPIQAPADAEACEALVRAVVEAEDVGTADEPPLQRYDFLVELTRADPPTTHTALVTRLKQGPGAEPLFEWQLPPVPLRRRVPAAVLPQDLGSGAFLASLREPVLLRLAPSNLAEIVVHRGTQTVFQAAVGKDEGWSAAEAPAILALAQELAAQRVEALAPPSLEPYGLRDPVFSVAFRLRDRQQPPRIVVLGGPAPEGGRYAGVKGLDSVFVLSPEATAILEAPLRQRGLLPAPAPPAAP